MGELFNIVKANETIFFSQVRGVLRQWIEVTIESEAGQNLAATLKITAGCEEVFTPLEITPGRHDYRGYAAVLWPQKPADENAVVQVETAAHQAEVVTTIGAHRPWTVYLLADVCTDATWVYGSYPDERKDDADLTYAELLLSEATRGGPEDNHNHYNLVHSLNLAYFEEIYPQHKPRLVEAIRRGEITLNPFMNMTLTQNVSLEEQIRHFYLARAWADEYGLEMGYANHQETPSIAWDMAGVLAGCGVNHLIKAILPYECPWAARLAEPPLFIWQGPDGSQILYRRRNWDYVEGKFVLKGVEATDAALHEKIIPEYEEMGERYPFDAISLLGCYGDLIPYEHGKMQSRDLPLLKAATIAEYNGREWEYPRLVNAAHKQYWDSIDAQIASRRIKLEVSRGDYGTGWDAWPVMLATVAASWRRYQERAGTADKLASILSVLNPAWYPRYHKDLQDGWRSLSMLADHAWNGANDANRALNTTLRREWIASTASAFDRVIEDGLVELGTHISSEGESRRLAVVNTLPWFRDGVIILENEGEDLDVISVESGEKLKTQSFIEDGRRKMAVKVDSVPSVGYHVVELQTRKTEPDRVSTWMPAPNQLEGPFYFVEVDPISGGISRLYDKVRGKDLVDKTSAYHINQCAHFSDGMLEPGISFQLLHPPKVSGGQEYTASAVTITPGPEGPVFACLFVQSEIGSIHIKTTITLYAELDRVDILNEVEKPPTSERQELDFYFPFNVPDRMYRYEAPGAVIEAGKDQLPGAGLSHAVTRHFVDVSNEEYGVTLSQADSFVIEFGHRSTTEDTQEIDPSNSTILVHALGNIFDSNEAIRDQGGDSHFVFRFSLKGHAGGFDPVAAVHFAWEDNNELLTAAVQGSTVEDLPADSFSFISTTPSNAILTTLKPAEENGLIARLWECAGSSGPLKLLVTGEFGLKAAMKTDHLEHDQKPLRTDDRSVVIPAKPCGITTLRIVN